VALSYHGFICYINNRNRCVTVTASEPTKLLHSQDFERLHQNLCSDRTRTRLAAKTVKFQEFMIPLSSQAALLELLTRGAAVYVHKSFIFTAILFIQVCNLCEQTKFVTWPHLTLKSVYRMGLLKLQCDREYTRFNK
jgi:hypothetical protein